MLPSKDFIKEKLKELGPILLKEPYKSNWKGENPTYGYCYIVSEAFYHYLKDANVSAFCMNFGLGIGTHWFLKVNEEIIDYTEEQFSFKVNHDEAKGKGFFKGSIKTERGFISKRGYEMAKHLELI